MGGGGRCDGARKEEAEGRGGGRRGRERGCEILLVQAGGGKRDRVGARGIGEVYKRQVRRDGGGKLECGAVEISQDVNTASSH